VTEQVDVRPLEEVLLPETFTEETFREIDRTAFGSPKQLAELRRLLATWDEVDFGSKYRNKTEASVIRGYCHYVNGELERAEELLKHARNEPWGYYWLIRVTLDLSLADKALNMAEKAHERFPESEPLTWLLIDVWITTGWEDEAEKLMAEMRSAQRRTSRYHFLQGYLADRRGEYEDAIDLYRRSADADPDSARALFRLAYLSGLHGDEDEAIACYEACSKLVPVPVNALINLGVLYEDRERYDDALRVYRSVLEYYPNHPRAKLFSTDADASTSMFYDREREKELSRRNQILRIPVTDFELSVRSRNCLAKMNIETLGDLIMKNEPELLAYKNFGETSLLEIKAILAQKGLRLGQGLEDRAQAEQEEIEEIEKGVDPEVLNRPIETLNLSIRSRRCMERLKIRSIRDLIHKSEVELMAAKNFGMTSLNEVKEKLDELGLKLRA
jgi:DNA-directed RNA polymerase subunit alpha